VCFESGTAETTIFAEWERVQELLPGSHFVRMRFGPDLLFDENPWKAWTDDTGRVVPPRE